jgi:predicted ATPase
MAYGASLVPLLGYNADQVNATFRQVHLLSQKLAVETVGPVLRALAISSLVRCEFVKSYNYGQQLLDLADRNQDTISRVEGYYVQGVASYWQGHLIRARQILSRAIDSYDPGQQDEHLALYSQDPKVVCQSRLAADLWFLGYPEQAIQTNREAVALARKLGHPNSLGIALTWTSWLYHLNRDTNALLKQTDEAIAYCDQEKLVFWRPINTILNGWAIAKQNGTEEGLSQLQRGLADFEASSSMFVLPYFRSLLAGVLAESGKFDEGLALLNNSINLAEQSGERWGLSEMQRMRGKLLLAGGAEPALIEESYLRAIEVAQEQQAREIELRAVIDLCQLWQKQGKLQEARQMLAEIYDWFTEGFELEELKKARMILDSLS